MALMLNKVYNVLKFNFHRNICILNPVNAYWNKDWLPNSHPKSIDEYNLAAEKYNLHPKEYMPYPDNGFGYGDYPKLPFQGVGVKDPHYPYDHPEHRRNFNEPVHADINMLGEDRYDAGFSERYSSSFIIFSFVIIFGTLFGSCYISQYIPVFQPVIEKQYPWKSRTYYTFDELNKVTMKM